MALSGVESFDPTKKEIKIVENGYDNSKMKNDDFLKVLLADLKWQDPLEAKDISQFINNTVKLRQMEVLNNFQKTVELLKKVNQTNALLYASNLIGKKVNYEGNQTYVQNGKSHVSFKLDKNADTVNITIMDKDGNVVETKNFQNLKANKEYPFEIDNPDLQDGYYTIYIEAKNGENSIKSTIYSYGYVESVEKDNDKIYVSINNKKIEIDKISQIGG